MPDRYEMPQQLRDVFAAHALTGLYAAYSQADPPSAEQMAEWAYQVADAMLRERAKGKPDA